MTCLHNHDQILEFLRKIFLKGFQIYQNYLCALIIMALIKNKMSTITCMLWGGDKPVQYCPACSYCQFDLIQKEYWSTNSTGPTGNSATKTEPTSQGRSEGNARTTRGILADYQSMVFIRSCLFIIYCQSKHRMPSTIQVRANLFTIKAWYHIHMNI